MTIRQAVAREMAFIAPASLLLMIGLATLGACMGDAGPVAKRRPLDPACPDCRPCTALDIAPARR